MIVRFPRIHPGDSSFLAPQSTFEKHFGFLQISALASQIN